MFRLKLFLEWCTSCISGIENQIVSNSKMYTTSYKSVRFELKKGISCKNIDVIHHYWNKGDLHFILISIKNRCNHKNFILI